MRLSPVLSDPSVVVSVVGEDLGEQVSLRSELDVDVYRLQRDGSSSDLVVRTFGDAVGRGALDAAAGVLEKLAETPFPAERCPTTTPVLATGEGRHLLVTEYLEPVPAPSRGFVLAWCAGLLGRLATRDGLALPSGGGWHRLGMTPSEEIDEALRLGGEVGSSMNEVLELLASADDAAGLPETLVHSDLTPPNAVPQGAQAPVIIDWVGVGRGPRIWPLAFLLYAAGPRGAQLVADRYGRSVTLTDEEWLRLPGIMLARPLTLDVWSAAYERITTRQAAARSRQHRARVAAVVAALDVAVLQQ